VDDDAQRVGRESKASEGKQMVRWAAMESRGEGKEDEEREHADVVRRGALHWGALDRVDPAVLARAVEDGILAGREGGKGTQAGAEAGSTTGAVKDVKDGSSMLRGSKVRSAALASRAYARSTHWLLIGAEAGGALATSELATRAIAARAAAGR